MMMKNAFVGSTFIFIFSSHFSSVFSSTNKKSASKFNVIKSTREEEEKTFALFLSLNYS